MASSFFPEKSSRSLSFISVGFNIRAMSIGCSGAGAKDSSSSLVISISGSRIGLGLVQEGWRLRWVEVLVLLVIHIVAGCSDSSRCYVFSCLHSLLMGFLFPVDETPS